MPSHALRANLTFVTSVHNPRHPADFKQYRRQDRSIHLCCKRRAYLEGHDRVTGRLEATTGRPEATTGRLELSAV